MLRTTLDEIRRLEAELLRPEVRSDASRLDALLHPDFVEFGSSGTVWTRAEILGRLPTETGFSASITDFEARLLAPDIALATFKVEISRDTARAAASLRSSVWLRDAGTWRIRFHQGSLIPAHPA